MLQFSHVTHRFGTKTALRDFSLEIPVGQLFALLGRNGAGKTTSIKLLVGLLRPTEGAVFVGGQRVLDDPALTNRQIGYVPDQPLLYDKLTGREFLRFLGEMYGLHGHDLEEAIAQQAGIFQLDGFIDQLAESYSHGMKQRIVFAAAMLTEPKVLVVDEPLVGLDPPSIRLVKDLMRQKARSGMTILMSTHTLAVAEEIADRMGILHQGELIFAGTLPELRAHVGDDSSPLEQLYLTLVDNVPEEAPAGR